MPPKLYVVIPCYNEKEVLPITAPLFRAELENLISRERVSPDSRIMFVNDGSSDTTWDIIKELSRKDEHFIGISQSCNRGHQNAVLAGLMEAKDKCDITISADCDGQDDISAMKAMVDAYLNGNEIVYGVRASRETDTFFKRFTAQAFYKVLNMMGAEVIYNHADYRLISSRVLKEFANFKEVNLFLRGMIPLVGFKSTKVYYNRPERMGGETHYPLPKMINLAVDGITSLSVKPLRLIAWLGTIISILSFITFAVTLISGTLNGVSPNSMTLFLPVLCLLSGVQLICLGVVGEYIGKIYMETKARPRYIISERTWEDI